jgi:hypothetical protein
VPLEISPPVGGVRGCKNLMIDWHKFVLALTGCISFVTMNPFPRYITIIERLLKKRCSNLPAGDRRVFSCPVTGGFLNSLIAHQDWGIKRVESEFFSTRTGYYYYSTTQIH